VLVQHGRLELELADRLELVRGKLVLVQQLELVRGRLELVRGRLVLVQQLELVRGRLELERGRLELVLRIALELELDGRLELERGRLELVRGRLVLELDGRLELELADRLEQVLLELELVGRLGQLFGLVQLAIELVLGLELEASIAWWGQLQQRQRFEQVLLVQVGGSCGSNVKHQR
jgi:hypothetical protein